MAEKLSVQIALEGGKEIEQQLEDIGTAGKQAFSDISAAASRVGGFANLDPKDVTKKLSDMGVTGEAAITKIIAAVKKAGLMETIVNGVKAVENAFVALGTTVEKVVTILGKHAAASAGLGRAGVAAATTIAAAFGPLGIIILAVAAATVLLGGAFIKVTADIQKIDAEAIKLNTTFESFSKVLLGLRAAGVSSFSVIAAGIEALQANIDKLTLAQVNKALADIQAQAGRVFQSIGPQLEILRSHVNDIGPAGDAARKGLETLGEPIQDRITPMLEAMKASTGTVTSSISQLTANLAQMGSAGERARLMAAVLEAIQVEAGDATKAMVPMLQALQAMPAGIERNKAATDAFTGALGIEIAQLLNSGVSIADIVQKTKGLTQAQADAANSTQQTMSRISAAFSAALENVPVEKLTSALNGVGQTATSAFGAGTNAVGTMSSSMDVLIQKLNTAVAAMSQLQSGGGASGVPAPGFAGGGLIGGRGTGTSDSNFAWVSRGEHIMPARAVQQPGVLAFLEALRRAGGDLHGVMRGMGRFALGGLVTAPSFAGGGVVGMSHVTIAFPGLQPIGGLRASVAVVDELRHAAAMAQVRSGGRKPSRYS